MIAVKSEELHYLMRHIFLPPKLPQKADRDDTRDALLTEEVHRTLTEFDCLRHNTEMLSLAECISMVGNMQVARATSWSLSHERIDTQLSTMRNGGDDQQTIEKTVADTS